jgi:DHA1 family tetracycline resistance protein-like MFS transporter
MSEGDGAGRGGGIFGLSQRPAALWFVYIAMFMNTLSMGVIIPVFPELLRQVAHADNAHAAQIGGFFGAAWSLMQLIFAPWFGALSDRYGRRPIMLVSMFGMGLDFVIMALAPNLAWLFVGRIFAGITSASGSAAGAYVADVSDPDTRSRNFGRFMAASSAGIIMGPAIGGIVGVIDPRAPFWVAAVLAFLNGLYGLFVVPESLAHERRAPFRWSSANAVGSVRLLLRYPGLFGLASVIFIAQFASMSINSLFQFYVDFRFHWGSREIGFLMMALGLGNVLVQSFLAGFTARRLGDRRAVILGMAISVVGFVAMGIAPTAILFAVAMITLSLSGISGPANQSLMVQRVAVDEQGRLQGALSIFIGLTGLVAPIMFTQIFAWGVGPGAGLGLPGLPMLVGAALMVVALAAAYVYARPAPEAAEAAP